MGKMFHISDILTVATGRMLVFRDKMTMPDGTVRPALDTNTQGLVEILEHISGNELKNPADPRQFNKAKAGYLAPHVTQSLLEQLPWLREVRFPGEDMPDGYDEALQFCNDWVLSIAAEQGSEWFELEEDMSIGIVHTATFSGLGPRLN